MSIRRFHFLFIIIFLLGAVGFLRAKYATSDQALLKQWWKYRGDDQNILKCADVYKIPEQMLKDRDRYWTVQYRYFSGDILLTVSYPDSQATCVYVSKR